MNSVNKPEAMDLILYVYFVSKETLWILLGLNEAGVNCRAAAVKSLPVLNHSVLFSVF